MCRCLSCQNLLNVNDADSVARIASILLGYPTIKPFAVFIAEELDGTAEMVFIADCGRRISITIQDAHTTALSGRRITE